jgi:hypothetical protein
MSPTKAVTLPANKVKSNLCYRADMRFIVDTHNYEFSACTNNCVNEPI